jgi:hypothetical protein
MKSQKIKKVTKKEKISKERLGRNKEIKYIKREKL